VDPVTDPLLLRKSGSGGNRNRDLWINQRDSELNVVICRLFQLCTKASSSVTAELLAST
jgi:hypothetical protein